MKKIGLLLAALPVVASLPCSAGVDEIKQFFRAVLTPGAAVPGMKRFLEVVDAQAVLALPTQEVNDVLPLAKQALKSPTLEVRQYGLGLFMAVGWRPDSAKLLEPYVEDLGMLANEYKSGESPRPGIFTILATTHPNIIPKAVPYFLQNLNESGDAQETATIAYALVQALPSDREVLSKVVNLAKKRSDYLLTKTVLEQFGRTKNREPEALDLMGSGLDSANLSIRRVAVEAVSRLDRDSRAKFSTQLGRIARDEKESQEIRTMASAALSQQ